MTKQVYLTAWDERLLEKYISFYQSLHDATRLPTSPAQRHFVEVCRKKAQPRTQHEIAYVKFLAVESEKPDGGDSSLQARASPAASSPAKGVVPDDRVLAVVQALENTMVEDVSNFARSALTNITNAYRTGIVMARSVSSDAALWTTTLLSAPDLSQSIERWTGNTFGGLSDIYTRALDGSFLEGLKSGADYVSPSLHRLFEGHSLPDSWAAVKDALPADTYTEEIVGWFRSLGSDVVTPAGLSVATLSKSQYEALRGIATEFHIPEAWLIDSLSYTATELVASMIPALALALNWNRADGEDFARMAGAIGVGAVVSANPILMAITIASLARAYHVSKNGNAQEDWAKSVAKGGVASGIILTASAAIGGPAIVGILAGVGIAAGVSHAAKEDRVRQIAVWLQDLGSKVRDSVSTS